MNFGDKVHLKLLWDLTPKRRTYGDVRSACIVFGVNTDLTHFSGMAWINAGTVGSLQSCLGATFSGTREWSLLAQPEKLLCGGDGIGHGVLSVDDDGSGRMG